MQFLLINNIKSFPRRIFYFIDHFPQTIYDSEHLQRAYLLNEGLFLIFICKCSHCTVTFPNDNKT